MTRLPVFLCLPLWVSCASTPAPKADPFERAQAVHGSPDGIIKLTKRLPGEVKLTKSGIGYMLSAKSRDMDLTCVIAGAAQVDAGALFYSALRNTVDGWSKVPTGDGFRLINPWVSRVDGFPMYGLQLELKSKDGTVDSVPALVIAHHVARIYCVDGAHDDRNRLVSKASQIARGLLWKGALDQRLPTKSLLYLSVQGAAGNEVQGYQTEAMGTGEDGNLHFSESTLFFERGNGGAEFHAHDASSRQVTLPDGTLDEMTSAATFDGRRVASATFYRMENGDYRVTGVDEGKPIELTLKNVLLTSRGAIYHWAKEQAPASTRTFRVPMAERPWIREIKVDVLAVGEDGTRSLELEESTPEGIERLRVQVGANGLCSGFRRLIAPKTELVGTLAR